MAYKGLLKSFKVSKCLKRLEKVLKALVGHLTNSILIDFVFSKYQYQVANLHSIFLKILFRGDWCIFRAQNSDKCLVGMILGFACMMEKGPPWAMAAESPCEAGRGRKVSRVSSPSVKPHTHIT